MEQPTVLKEMNVLNKLTQFVLTYPVAVTGIVRSLILLGTAFGAHLTADQVAAIMLVVESVFSPFTHQQVTPLTKLS